jgi:hypothetical protein
MEKLNVRFDNKTKESIKSKAELHGITESKMARAALNIGLTEISKHSWMDAIDFDQMINSNQ